ncbi:MAG: class I SAM-dependent methyltransferase [Chloroflexota bacterium]|nr:class I SAM-dependent methyltransferase [Chloroflexota bacterium]
MVDPRVGTDVADFDRLVNDAVHQPRDGWDLGYLQGRLIEQPLSWDYRQLVIEHMGESQAMMDHCTGGGEWLATLPGFPTTTFATEHHEPNYILARARLEGRGIRVRQVDPGVENPYGPGPSPDGSHPERRLNFANGQFDLVVCRHASYCATEIARVLRPGGRFVTEQIGTSNHPALDAHLKGPRFVWNPIAGAPPPTHESADLEVIDHRDEKPTAVWRDIGAVVYYLHKVPWRIMDFSVERYRDQLWVLYNVMKANGGLATHYHRTLTIAVRR